MLRTVLASWMVWGQVSPGGAPEVLQPYGVSSPLREYRLEVEPGDKRGTGGGGHGLWSGGQEVWAGPLPHTLWDARVTGDGRVVGCAYPVGRGMGEVVLRVIDRAGRTVYEQEVAPDRQSRRAPHPRVTQLFHDPHGDRFVVGLRGVEEADPGERWFVLDVQRGRGLVEIGLGEVFEGFGARQRVMQVLELEGVPLRLVWWWVGSPVAARSSDGPRFALLDEQGREVWSVEDGGDYHLPDGRSRRILRSVVSEQGAVTSTGPGGRFAVWDVSEGQAVEYRAEAAEGGWRVDRLGAKPHPGGLPERLEVAPPVEVELVRVREVELEGGGPVPQRGLRLDAAGRVLIQEGPQVGFHAFELSGRKLFDAQASVETWPLAPSQLHPGPAGRVILHNGSVDDPRMLAFSASGGFLGLADLPPAMQVAFAPGGGRWIHRLSWRDCDLVEVDPDGLEGACVRRTPGGRWFETLQGFEVDEDGRLVVLGGQPDPFLAVYSPYGEPLLELPSRGGLGLAVDRDWIAVRSTRIELVRRRDGRRFLTQPVGSLVGLHPRCEELVVLAPGGQELHFYALPADRP